MSQVPSPDERRAINQREHGRRRYEAVVARAGGRQSWLYLIGSDEVRAVKIGISLEPESRLFSMQVGSPVLLRLLWKIPGSYDMEQGLHRAFDAYRKHGEWFDFGDEDPVAMVAGTAALLGYWRPPSAVAGIPGPAISPADTEPVGTSPVSPSPRPRPALPPVGMPPLPMLDEAAPKPQPSVDLTGLNLPPLPAPPSEETTT